MAIDIKFSKFDSTPWGFRLTGGSEYGLPMTVVRVYEGSLAESFGLREGDVLAALNEQGLVGMSHDTVHDCITKAGNNFIATVFRGSYDMEELQKFTARSEKEPLIPSSCLSQECFNNSLITTPTPLTNGTFVNKVPLDQNASSSPCTVTTSQLPPTSLFKPVAKQYKPFTKDINTTLPPLEKPSIANPISIDDFQTIKQKEYLETAKKLVPDICKYMDKKNIGRSTPTFVLENMKTVVENGVAKMVEKSMFDMNTKEFKSVKPPTKNISDSVGNVNDTAQKCEENGGNITVNEMKMDEKTNESTETVKETSLKIQETKVEANLSINKEVQLLNGALSNGVSKTQTSSVEKKQTINNENVVKDDVIINGGVLLDIDAIEMSVKIDDKKPTKESKEKVIEVIKESEDKAEADEKIVRKSVKSMVEDYTRTTTPSPSLYKMSCKIRNPSVTPVASEPLNVIEEVKIIKEEIIHYSPIPRTTETKPKAAKQIEALKPEKCKAKTPCPSPIMFSKEVHELSTTGLSLEEAKINAISAASVLSHEAKQRNYKVPCVSASIPSQNQTDVLLKTFFIHLTDVMVALTKMITTNECCHCGRVISDCNHKSADIREKSETVSNLVKEISEKVSNTQVLNQINTSSQKNTDKVVIEKLQEKKIEHRNEAIQTEALKEVFQNTSKLGVDVTVNGKDPLLWLADMDEKKVIQEEKTKSLEVISKGKILEEASVKDVVTETKESKKVIEEAKAIVETIATTAVQSAEMKTQQIDQGKTESVEQKKVEIIEAETKQIEHLKEKAIVIQQVGENEYSVSMAKPKSDIVSIEDNLVVEKQEEIFAAASQETQIIEEVTTEKIEETNLHIEETSASMKESECIDYVEEITSEPIKKAKKPKKKKMMKAVAKDPLTPNTDEFFFRLDVKLEGLRSKTPEPPKEHEDFSIVKKSDQTTTDKEEIIQDPQMIADKKSSLKLDLRNKPDEVFVLVCQPSSEDSTPSGEIVTKKTAVSMSKELSGSIKSELIDVKTGKAEIESTKIVEASKENKVATSDTNALNINTAQAYVCDLSANSYDSSSTNKIPLNVTDVPKETIGTFVVGDTINVEQHSSQASAHVSSFIQTKDDQSKLATDSNTAATLQTKESTVLQNGQLENMKAETKVTSILNDVKISAIETGAKKEEIKQETKTMLETISKCNEASEMIATKNETSERKMSSEDATKIDHSKISVCEMIMAEQTVETSKSSQLECKNLGSVETNNLTNCQLISECITEEKAAEVKTKEAIIGYATTDSSRITNGLNGQEEDLGKAGLTDEEIADILSGEAEVLKDQHVIGLQKVLASHMSRPDENDDSRINFNKMMPVIGFLKESEVFKALNEESIKSRAELLEEQRKQTKFLQKPNRPIPFCKRLADKQPKEPGYKVDIRSQKKRDSLQNGSSILTEGVFLIPEVPILVPEPPPELYVAPEYLEDSAFPDLEDTGIPIPVKKPVTPKPEETTSELAEEVIIEDIQEEENKSSEDTQEAVTDGDNMKDTQEIWKDLTVDEAIDESLPVEEQLLKVQKQLEALSKLPQAIQQTLDIVTKQLVKMVPRGDTPAPPTITEEQIVQENGETEPQESTEQRICVCPPTPAECAEITQITNAIPQNGCAEMEMRVSSRTEEDRRSVQFQEKVEVREIRNSFDNGACGDIQKMKQDVIDQLTMEHMSRQVKQRPTSQTGGPTSYKVPKQPMFGPLTPEARPIVLPGGRKWRGPKDAFTDTFIAETLSGQATVIQGKAIGSHPIPSDSHSSGSVDFNKFNKPPISLDHLKDSPVYKLVHEIEDEPVHGVANRTRAISESEYRERCRSVTPNHLENGGVC